MTKNTLTKTFLTEMKSLLLEQKGKLENDLKQFASKNPNVDGDYDARFPDYGDEDDDNAREVAEYTAKKPLEITLEKMLRDVNKALVNMKDGSYGMCKYCDQPIQEKRLRARATSSSCVSCKKTLTEEA
jgi:RNA polymerase-binding transcription factor DksA